MPRILDKTSLAISFKDDINNITVAGDSMFSRTRKSMPAPFIDSKVVRQQFDMPASLYADFIESGTTSDIDVFLTRVS